MAIILPVSLHLYEITRNVLLPEILSLHNTRKMKTAVSTIP